ncbi:unnamed protein product [Vicia faba]|uniref:RING-type domain-containing protein n=1 Tax=Vicia faba TaxID=3906 RepID=A0AAV0Z8L9_VICFA|nr:unnamed protein product [Vicia faba]
MAELSELFPSDKQFDGLVHMYVHVITFDPPTFVMICVLITMFFFIFHQIFHGLFYWFVESRPIHINERDIEQGDTDLIREDNDHDHDDDDHDHDRQNVTIFHTLVFSNLQAWTILAGIEEEQEQEDNYYDEKRGQKLRACKKLPPLMNYDGVGKHDHELRRSCDECAICLEDFQVGQLCQVFPVCRHIFHVECIDHWLQRKFTCPICRNCL